MRNIEYTDLETNESYTLDDIEKVIEDNVNDDAILLGIEDLMYILNKCKTNTEYYYRAMLELQKHLLSLYEKDNSH